MALMAVRQQMVDAKKVYKPAPEGEKAKPPGRAAAINGAQYCRRFINQSVGRIRRIFKWGVSRQFVDVMVLGALKTLEPLLAERSEAKDYPARQPVPLADIDAVKAELKSERTKDLIDLALLCGARPGELLNLTGEMIDRDTHKRKKVWVADLKNHKMAHKGKRRVSVFGKKAQAILKRYMPDDPKKRLFEVARASVSSTIKAACIRAGVPEFTTHWLRHTTGTRIRKEFGLDASQVTLGYANADITELYAGLDLDKAIEVAQKSG